MIHLKIKRLAVIVIAICMVFASVSYVKADGEEYPDASNTTLSKTKMTLYYNEEQGAIGEVALINAPEFTEYAFDYECSNASLDLECFLDITRNVITIQAWNTGSGRITFTLNNKQLYLDIKVVKISINKTSLLIVKKKKSTLKLKKYSGTVKWKTTNKKVVSVSSKGVVKGKKTGNALVYAKVKGQYFGCAVSVITKKMKTIVNKAYSLGRGKYSQPKRMKKGYYDCSSLVWRAYKKGKIYLGNKHIAPVAADIAKYFVRTKKRRIKGGHSKSNIAKMKLRVGDLFFCEGNKNGRYRGIYHVEMFTGYRCLGIDSSGRARIVARWATAPDDYYLKIKQLMVRPTK